MVRHGERGRGGRGYFGGEEGGGNVQAVDVEVLGTVGEGLMLESLFCFFFFYDRGREGN